MRRGSFFRSRGWTLVELLVAMTLSLLVIAGIGQIYLAAKRSYDIQTNLAQIQDVGRYVTDVLTHDIHMAGYWGLMDMNTSPPPTINNDATPDSCPTGATSINWGKMITRKIFGLNDTAAGYACIGDKLSGSGDILVVRYANPTPITTNAELPSPPPNIYDPSRLYIRTAPFQGSIFQGYPVGNPDNLVTSPIFSDHTIAAHAYYVADPISTECGDVPVFARKTLDIDGTPLKQSLVNGVEQMQFQYGVDTAITPANPLGDGSVNQYFDADQITCTGTAPCWYQVRAVRFWVLVRADCQESGYTDTNIPYQLGAYTYTPPPGDEHYRRALYSSTVALRN